MLDLVTDEYAEIRLEACTLLAFDDENTAFNDNFVLQKLFEYIFKNLKILKKDCSNSEDVLNFVLN